MRVSGSAAGWLVAAVVGLITAAPPLVVYEAWMRPAAAPGGTTAAYLRIDNPGRAPHTIVAVSSPAATAVEVHRMRHEGAIMRMERIERLTVPPGETVTLAPGGLHLMVIGVTRPLPAGSRVPLRFTLEGGLVVETQAVVREEGGSR